MEWQFGNLTAQAASNLNLTDFDSYVVNVLKLDKYVRYVDDIVIILNNKKYLIDCIPFIIRELEKTHQKISTKKTKIDTVYHGVPFLGKVSYPYGYQKSNKQVIKRTYQKARDIKYEGKSELLAKANSQIGTLKNYNCKKLILNYVDMIKKQAKDEINFDYNNFRFF